MVLPPADKAESARDTTVRQSVLAFPHALRYRLAYDASLVTDVLRLFTNTIFASLIQRAREFGAVRNATRVDE